MPTYTLPVTRADVLSPDLAAFLAQRLSPYPCPPGEAFAVGDSLTKTDDGVDLEYRPAFHTTEPRGDGLRPLMLPLEEASVPVLDRIAAPALKLLALPELRAFRQGMVDTLGPNQPYTRYDIACWGAGMLVLGNTIRQSHPLDAHAPTPPLSREEVRRLVVAMVPIATSQHALLPFLAQANTILEAWIAAKADRAGTQMAADWAGVRATFHA